MELDPIAHYITNLLHAAKLDALPESARVEVAQRIREQVDRRIGLVAIANLDDDGIAAYTDVVEGVLPSAADVQAFLTARIPEYAEKLRAALDAYAAEYIAAATAPRAT